MTTIYRAAAVVALVPAIGAGVEWTRDRSPAIAAWALSMMAMSASLAVAAAVPAVMPNGSEPAAKSRSRIRGPGSVAAAWTCPHGAGSATTSGTPGTALSWAGLFGLGTGAQGLGSSLPRGSTMTGVPQPSLSNGTLCIWCGERTDGQGDGGSFLFLTMRDGVDRFGGSVGGGRAGRSRPARPTARLVRVRPSQPPGSQCRVRRPRSRSGPAAVSEARSARRGRDGLA